jgi:AmmeMemoRadiSam system protein B/AmmeMemoRadiSam system protein A
MASALGYRAAGEQEVLPAEVADLPVMGAFVTLKRSGRLRACCGVLGVPMPLSDAVRNAALRTATEDSRFPTISPTELPFQQLEVSLLHNFQTVEQRGGARVQAVEVGRHGLQIRREGAAGLLLPGVAVENGYQSEEFLRQVCLKAGLPATAWEDGHATLQTFETLSMTGPFAVPSTGSWPQPASLVTAEDLNKLIHTCGMNLSAILQGATPSYFIQGCGDGNVNAVTLLLTAAGAEPLHVFRLSMRPGMPLQSSLFSLTEAVAGMLRSGQWRAQGEVRMSLALLYDPAMHGTTADPDLRGIDPSRRALFVVEGSRSAWSFDPTMTPDQLLRNAMDAGGIRSSSTASVFSFSAQCTEPRVTVSNSPRGAAGPAVRPPAVAGTFYPAQPGALAQMLDKFLSGEPVERRRWPAVMVPHAGLVYSGRIAASVFQRVEFPDTAIILCPKHTRLGVDLAVAPHREWSFPGGVVAGDADLARELAESIPGWELDAAAHRQEHAIEVQLPLLARLAPKTRIVAVSIGGSADYERCREFAVALARVLEKREERPLLIISSDMNHYASDAENRRLDEIALSALTQLNPESAYRAVADRGITMCGLRPATIAMETLKQLGGLTHCERVAYATSADVTGDRTRVVGYAGLLFA